VRSPRTAALLAVAIEEEVAAAYVGAIAVTGGSERPLAIRALAAAAVRAATWRGKSVPFPGLRGRAPS
ncbi:MAG: DUF4439 domain-containing protein, partial [Actinomycetota bacterium]|nr:DUF4439 domain-containing protein [Actinomycetota bacterium]